MPTWHGTHVSAPVSSSLLDSTCVPASHPPEAPSLGHLQGEVLQPYVTVEVHGGTFSGAASTLQSVVQGSRFKSGYADNGFAPTWEGQSCECARKPCGSSRR